MRIVYFGVLAASLALGACSNNAPATDEKAPQAGAVEEGVTSDAVEIEELPVEEGAPAPDAAPADEAAPADTGTEQAK